MPYKFLWRGLLSKIALCYNFNKNKHLKSSSSNSVLTLDKDKAMSNHWKLIMVYIFLDDTVKVQKIEGMHTFEQHCRSGRKWEKVSIRTAHLSLSFSFAFYFSLWWRRMQYWFVPNCKYQIKRCQISKTDGVMLKSFPSRKDIVILYHLFMGFGCLIKRPNTVCFSQIRFK